MERLIGNESLADRILKFQFSLPKTLDLPKGITLLYPYEAAETRALMTRFYQKYFKDNRPRTLIFGINPGRFGAGVTGVPFTDPLKLEENCGIENDFQKKRELSAQFVYRFINAFGGPKAFYGAFLITSLSPLGFLKDGKNYNYYDSKALQNAIEPFIIQTIRTQMNFGVNEDTAICLGNGKNYQYFDKLNKKHQFFKKILPLPHPRWVMQYRRKDIKKFTAEYMATLLQALPSRK